MEEIPRASILFLPFSDKIIYGSPEDFFPTEISFHPTFFPIPVPSAFEKASFVANLAAKLLAGLAVCLQYAISRSSKILKRKAFPYF
jgi:hypothetical protein